MAEQTFFLHQHINDFDEFCSNARHWDMEYHQLEAGQFSSELLMFGGASTLFSRAQLHRGMIQRGSSPQGLITFGLLANPKINMHWRNIDISGDMLFIFPPGGELHGITQSDFDVFAISLSEKKLNQLCAAHELPEFNVLQNKNEVFRCHSAKLAALRKYLLSIEQALLTGTGATRSFHYLEQIEQEIAANIVGLIAESYQPINRKPLRKRDNALKLAESYIFESDGAVVTIPELCIAAHASQRTLEYAFRERYDCTPKAYTLIYRLNNAHKQLRHAEPGITQISDIAQQHGFWHMGQFCADYKKLFAMLPSETLKRKI
ncbi:MAG: helix-turn-helix domain-containing protein [Thiotrichaceae bacterium]|nr:helix-turn-helix domain-containing protein [Thiotrichaceae bacterium]